MGFCLTVLIWFVPVVETVLCVPPAGGFDPASLSAHLTTAILISVCCYSGFIVGVREGLRVLSNLVALVIPHFTALFGS